MEKKFSPALTTSLAIVCDARSLRTGDEKKSDLFNSSSLDGYYVGSEIENWVCFHKKLLKYLVNVHSACTKLSSNWNRLLVTDNLKSPLHSFQLK